MLIWDISCCLEARKRTRIRINTCPDDTKASAARNTKYGYGITKSKGKTQQSSKRAWEAMKPLVFLSDEVSLLRARSEVLFLKRAEKREAAWSVRALHAADSYVCKSKFGGTRVRVGTESRWLHDDTALSPEGFSGVVNGSPCGTLTNGLPMAKGG